MHRTRANLSDGLSHIFHGKKIIDKDLLEAIETQLLMADVGVAATQSIIDDITAKVARHQLSDANAFFQVLKEHLAAILTPCEKPLQLTSEKHPFVILMVGVNGRWENNNPW